MSRKVLVIGDLMLDKYLEGDATRISPEAPVPVIHIKNETYQLGGALNVALNLRNLDMDVIPIGVIGNDNESDICVKLCEQYNIDTSGLFFTSERRTTVKARVVADGQHIVRVDKEDVTPISRLLEHDIIHKIEQIVLNYTPEYILISDYNKGVLTYSVIVETLKIAATYDVKVLVDPKYNNFNLYKNVYLIKPNFKEAIEYVKKLQLLENTKNERPELQTPQYLAALICEKLEPTYLAITLGKKGILLQDNKKHIQYDIHAPNQKHVYDVTGAGDVVLAIITYYDSQKLPMNKTIEHAVKVGSYVVSKFGTSTIDKKFVYSLDNLKW